jgi:zinc D-Ala-D-Ala carboxypeptidase
VKKVYLLIILIGLAIFGVWYRVSDSSPSSKQTVSSSKSQPNKPDPQIPAFNKSKYSTSEPSSIWVVVNKQRPLNPILYSPSDLVLVSGQKLRQEAATALSTMFNDATTQGLSLLALSGFRSYQTQVSVYANEVKRYGQAVADTQSAKPGHSEHQTGLAVDIGGGGCGIEDCFGNTREGKWVAENAYKYGFLVRYNKDNQNITGYRAEPWHLRFVGADLATEMRTTGIDTLEEFFNL